MNDNSLEEKKNKLLQKIEESREKFEKKRQTNLYFYYGLTLAGIVLSGLAAIVGFLNLGILSGILPIVVGMAVTFETAIKFGEKKDFFRILVAECRNLKIALEFQVNNEDTLQVMVEKYKHVVEEAAKGVPRGKGMEAVKKLYEGLDKKGIIRVPQLEG